MDGLQMNELVGMDSAKQNALVKLSAICTDGSVTTAIGKEHLQTLLPKKTIFDQWIFEYLTRVTNDGGVPQTIDLEELVRSARDVADPDSLASAWSEVNTEGYKCGLIDAWLADYFNEVHINTSDSNRSKAKNYTIETKESIKEGKGNPPQISSTQFLDNFDDINDWTQEYIEKLSEANRECDLVDEWSKEFFFQKGKRHNSDLNRDYIFQRDNPFLCDIDLLGKGKYALKSGMLADAILYLEAAIQRDHRNVEAWYLLGKCHSQNEDDAKAIPAYIHGLTLQADDPEAAENILIPLATSCINESQERVALWYLERCVYIFSDQAQLERFREFDSQNYKPNIDELEKRLIKAQKQFPESNHTLVNALSVLYAIKGDHNLAVDCLELMLRERPNDYITWNRLGATFANWNRFPEAVAAYSQALQLYPCFTRARYNLGLACMHLGSCKEAVDHFLSALELQQRCGSVRLSGIWRVLQKAAIQAYKSPWYLVKAVERRDLTECCNHLITHKERHVKMQKNHKMLILFMFIMNLCNANPLLPADSDIIPTTGTLKMMNTTTGSTLSVPNKIVDAALMDSKQEIHDKIIATIQPYGEWFRDDSGHALRANVIDEQIVDSTAKKLIVTSDQDLLATNFGDKWSVKNTDSESLTNSDLFALNKELQSPLNARDGLVESKFDEGDNNKFVIAKIDEHSVNIAPTFESFGTRSKLVVNQQRQDGTHQLLIDSKNGKLISGDEERRIDLYKMRASSTAGVDSEFEAKSGEVMIINEEGTEHVAKTTHDSDSSWLEETFWRKLISGIKCSHRDCNEAIKAKSKVAKHLLQPSISRARKHANNVQIP